MLFPDEGSIALKELSGILDEFLARRYRLRLGGFRIRELLCNLRHFTVEARLIPCRRRAFNARILVDKSQMDVFELLHPNLTRGFGDRGAGTE